MVSEAKKQLTADERRPRWLRPATLAAALLASLLIPLVLSTFNTFLATEILILALFSVSFNMLLGYTGMVSFGQAGYYGLGAYAAGLFVVRMGLPMPVAFVLAPLVAAAGAALVGAIAVRRAHAYFIMLTLAFGQIVYAIALSWSSVTGGDNGLLGVRPIDLLRGPTNYYYFTLVVVVVCLFAMHRLVNSPFGSGLKAIRENPLRAEAIGINVFLHRWIIFIVAGFFSGVAGALLAFFQRSIFPDAAFYPKSFDPLITTVLGGVGNFFGPVVGSIVLVLLERIVVRFTEHWLLVVGGLVIVVVIGFSRGITGFDIFRFFWRR
ncbi:MAG: branched-chain amino acid ABC transporter permease [Chloroflexi bacterium]|nr:branched-chain amino acid ABC transporter permease [Chloroflexota bacterium]